MRYAVELYLERIGETFTWELSERSLCRLRVDLDLGELGPIRILQLLPIAEEAAAA